MTFHRALKTVLAGIGVTALVATAEAGTHWMVAAKKLHLRAGPGSATASRAILDRGAVLESRKAAKEASWLGVRHQGKAGYVHTDYVVPMADEQIVQEADRTHETGSTLPAHFSHPVRAELVRVNPGAIPLEVAARRLNFRAQPEGKVQKTLVQGRKLEVLPDTGARSHPKWIRVATDGQSGFVHRDYVRIPGVSKRQGVQRKIARALARAPGAFDRGMGVLADQMKPGEEVIMAAYRVRQKGRITGRLLGVIPSGSDPENGLALKETGQGSLYLPKQVGAPNPDAVERVQHTIPQPGAGTAKSPTGFRLFVRQDGANSGNNP